MIFTKQQIIAKKELAAQSLAIALFEKRITDALPKKHRSGPVNHNSPNIREKLGYLKH